MSQPPQCWSHISQFAKQSLLSFFLETNTINSTRIVLLPQNKSIIIRQRLAMEFDTKTAKTKIYPNFVEQTKYRMVNWFTCNVPLIHMTFHLKIVTFAFKVWHRIVATPIMKLSMFWFRRPVLSSAYYRNLRVLMLPGTLGRLLPDIRGDYSTLHPGNCHNYDMYQVNMAIRRLHDNGILKPFNNMVSSFWSALESS